MKILKKSAFLLLAAAAMASCSKTEIGNEGGPVAGSDDIVAKSSLSKMDAVTRAPFVGELSKENPLVARVITSKTPGDYSTIYSEGKMIFKGSEFGVPYEMPMVSIAGTQRFPSPEFKVYMIGLTPYDYTVDPSAETAKITIDGRQDVMYAPEVVTTKLEVQNLKFASLDFEHKLTKLELRARADGQAAIDKFGKITKLELLESNDAAGTKVVGIYPDITVKLATGETTAAGTLNTAFPWYNMSVDEDDVVSYSDVTYVNGKYKLTTDATRIAYTLIPAMKAGVAAGDFELKLKISYTGDDDVPMTKEVEVNLKDKEGNDFAGSTKGYSFLITLNFSDGEINAVATVQEWYEGGDSIIIIE